MGTKLTLKEAFRSKPLRLRVEISPAMDQVRARQEGDTWLEHPTGDLDFSQQFAAAGGGDHGVHPQNLLANRGKERQFCGALGVG
jgi:hypothetical protein